MRLLYSFYSSFPTTTHTFSTGSLLGATHDRQGGSPPSAVLVPFFSATDIYDHKREFLKLGNHAVPRLPIY
jgi:hypothetical protein